MHDTSLKVAVDYLIVVYTVYRNGFALSEKVCGFSADKTLHIKAFSIGECYLIIGGGEPIIGPFQSRLFLPLPHDL